VLSGGVTHATVLSEGVAPVLKGFAKLPIVGPARALGLPMGVSFRDPKQGDDWLRSRASPRTAAPSATTRWVTTEPEPGPSQTLIS
jgi:hypothetical protein